jgi:hypothetical protein
MFEEIFQDFFLVGLLNLISDSWGGGDFTILW